MSWIESLIKAFDYAWPFREVEGWEKGVYTILGKPGRTVGPGRWPVIPYFMDVKTVSMVPAVLTTPLQFVTLANGKVASFSASVEVCPEDPRAAIFEIDDYRETTQELAAAILAQELAEASPDRFDTARKRRNLVSDMAAALDATTREYGVRVRAIRLTNFAVDLRLFRLVQDSATLQPPSW